MVLMLLFILLLRDMASTLYWKTLNPLNVRYSALNRWKGQKGNYNGFAMFELPSLGLRAGLITLRTYINKHGLTSVSKIIARFAPATENNTANYIFYVSGKLAACGYSTYNIKFGSSAFCVMVQAMAMFETQVELSIDNIMEVINYYEL